MGNVKIGICYNLLASLFRYLYIPLSLFIQSSLQLVARFMIKNWYR